MTTVTVTIATSHGDSTESYTASASAEEPLFCVDAKRDSLSRTLAREMFEEIRRASGGPQAIKDKAGEIIGWVMPDDWPTQSQEMPQA